MSGAIPVAALAFVFHACAGPALAPPAAKTAEVASTRSLPLTVEELKNVTYAGPGERLGPVTLANGRWTGAPPALGAASRPSLEQLGGARTFGFMLGRLAIAHTRRDGSRGTMLFDADTPPKDR